MNKLDFDNIDHIAIEEAKRAVLALGAEASTEDRLRAAMRVTRDHWLLTQMGPNEGRCLRAAVAGTCLAIGDAHPDYHRLADEHRALSNFSHAIEAAQAGVSVNMAETGRRSRRRSACSRCGAKRASESL